MTCVLWFWCHDTILRLLLFSGFHFILIFCLSTFYLFSGYSLYLAGMSLTSTIHCLSRRAFSFKRDLRIDLGLVADPLRGSLVCRGVEDGHMVFRYHPGPLRRAQGFAIYGATMRPTRDVVAGLLVEKAIQAEGWYPYDCLCSHHELRIKVPVEFSEKQGGEALLEYVERDKFTHRTHPLVSAVSATWV